MATHSPKVVIPMSKGRVRVDKIQAIVCNRTQNDEDEQYLVQWKTEKAATKPPLSWHPIQDLDRALEYVQDYLDTRQPLFATKQGAPAKKRKTPDTDKEHPERRPSPFDRRLLGSSNGTHSASRASSVSSGISDTSTSVTSAVVFNGVLDADGNGFVFARSEAGRGVQELRIDAVPTPSMVQAARHASVDLALTMIRNEYLRRLAKVNGPKIHLLNLWDKSTPSLRFRYIDDYVLRDGVYRVDPAAQVGCTQCSPHMGQNIGCEYTKKCDCLEYAAVDESRLNDQQRREYTKILKNGGSTIGLPKKFPYYTPTSAALRAFTLVPFYLNSRRPIYECNDKCRCGQNCRNKNVQFGRQIELQIFKTKDNRGWGLRCPVDIRQGQFIDTYRGEIITDAEATRREDSSSKMKMSYLYSLDKFQEAEGIPEEDIYVVDGEFMGGPSKFINHSCDPNCRQYTVSYNKHDPRVYDLAFFACKDIPANTELTFDYLDKEEGEESDEPGEGAIPCLCGSEKCRKWLWT